MVNYMYSLQPAEIFPANGTRKLDTPQNLSEGDFLIRRWATDDGIRGTVDLIQIIKITPAGFYVNYNLNGETRRMTLKFVQTSYISMLVSKQHNVNFTQYIKKDDLPAVSYIENKWYGWM